MDQVYVVTKTDDDKGYTRQTVVGVFTNRSNAVKYCNSVDPKEKTHGIDDCEVDSLTALEQQKKGK